MAIAFHDITVARRVGVSPIGQSRRTYRPSSAILCIIVTVSGTAPFDAAITGKRTGASRLPCLQVFLDGQLRPVPEKGGTTATSAGLYHTLQMSQARVTFTIFRFAGRSADSETLRFRSCVDAWARTCRGVDTDSEGEATMGALCGSDDALTDAGPPAVSSSWLLRRCTPNIFGRETAESWISAAGLDAYIQGSPQRLRHRSTQELARTGTERAWARVEVLFRRRAEIVESGVRRFSMGFPRVICACYLGQQSVGGRQA